MFHDFIQSIKAGLREWQHRRRVRSYIKTYGDNLPF